MNASGLIALAFFSEINSISEPKHFRPTFSGFLSLIYCILFLVNPKCWRIIFPLVLAPNASTDLLFLIIPSTNLTVFDFNSVITFSKFKNVSEEVNLSFFSSFLNVLSLLVKFVFSYFFDPFLQM